MKKYISRVLIGTGFVIIAAAFLIEVATIYCQNQIVKEYNQYIDELENHENA